MKPGLATSIGLAVALALVAAGVFAQSAPVANSRVIPSLVQNSTDAGLDEREYSHAKRVDFIPWGETASMAAAA